MYPHVWAQFQLVCYGIDKRMLTDPWSMDSLSSNRHIPLLSAG